MSAWTTRQRKIVLDKGTLGIRWSDVGASIGWGPGPCSCVFDRYASAEQKASRAAIVQERRGVQAVANLNRLAPAPIENAEPTLSVNAFTDDPRAIRQCGLPRFYAPASENLRSFSGSSATYAAGMG